MKRVITAMCLVFVVAAGVWAQCNTTCTQIAPGLRYPLIDWRFVNSGNLPQTQGVWMNEDIISIRIEDGAPLGVSADEMEMVLTATVDWRKEVQAFSACNGRGTSISTQGSSKGPVHMRLNRTNCTADTVILRKEKFLQGMVDVYHFDPNRFWRLWAGKKITINWSNDNYWGSFPPACSFPCVPVGTISTGGTLYDTDNKADIAVWRPFDTSATWFAVNSSTGASVNKKLGKSGDRPLPYDYDGDGRTDMAVWRPSTGDWIVINSLTGQTRTVQWGTFGDMPVPGDFDGDGKADLAVWRPTTSTWFIKGYITGAQFTRFGGPSSDIEAAADYDGDGVTDPASWTYATSIWNIFVTAPYWFQWGTPNDYHVPADYDGDRKADIAVFRDGTWWIHKSTGSDFSASWGVWGDKPVPKDYDGDGKADLAIYRPWTSEWWILRSSDGQWVNPMFGGETDTPVPSK
jgi:VCBS repeat protein